MIDTGKENLLVCALCGLTDKNTLATLQDLSPSIFGDPVHADIARTAQRLWRQHGEVTVDLVQSAGDDAWRELVEVRAFPLGILSSTVSGPIALEARRIVTQLARVRKARELAEYAEHAAQFGDLTKAEEHYGGIAAALMEGRQARQSVSIGEVGSALAARYTSKTSTVRGVGMETGIGGWDAGTLGLLGLHRTHLTILAARPAMGKTALALNIAWHVAKTGVPVLFSCGEMTSEELGERLLSHITQIEYSRIRTGRIDSNQLESVHRAFAEMSRTPLHLWDAGRVTATDLLAQARLVGSKEGKPVGLLVVDYLQRMGCDHPYREPRHKVAHNAEALKTMAQDEDMCVLALAQLNRGLEGRGDKRPLMADLREAGEIEQEANEILCLYRHGVYYEETPDHVTELIVRKARGARTGTIDLSWHGATMTFKDA